MQEEEIFKENSATSKVIGERTIQFRSHDGCITTLQGIFLIQGTISSLGALQGKEFSFSSKGDLMKVSKETHVKF